MNKLLILIAAFLLTIQFSNAQTTTGTQNLGFYFGFNSNRSDHVYINPADFSRQTYVTRYTNLNLGPTYNYFIASNLDIGATLTYSHSLINYSGFVNGIEKQANSDVGGTVFIRKYFLYENKIGFRTGPYLGYDRGTQKTTNVPSPSIYDENSITNNYSAGLRLDLVYYPLKHIGFAATLANLNYNNYKSNNTMQGSNSGYNLNLNLVTSGVQLSAFLIF
jgi:hypothetical protein